MYTVDPQQPDPDVIAACSARLRSGEVVAFPTETVYGLGADALNPRAVAGIFRAKGRPADNPLIVHVADVESGLSLARDVPPVARHLAERFWPGPLTLILHRGDALPDITTAGLPTFGVRLPAHPVALALLKATGHPVAAPSANLSGKPSPTTAQHVMDDLAGRIDAILDGGATDVGLESTVLDVTVNPPVILRPGGVSHEDLSAFLDLDVTTYESSGGDGGPRSPGTKYRHYAPRARVTIIEGSSRRVAEEILRQLGTPNTPGTGLPGDVNRRRAYVVSDETASMLAGAVAKDSVQSIGPRDNPRRAARQLYDTFRRLDDEGVEDIYIELFDERGIGRALVDRIRRAVHGSDDR